jgi:formyl-CoA transferase
VTLHRPDLIDGHLDLSKQNDFKDKLNKIFLKKNFREWLEIFKDVHAGVSPVFTLEEIVCDHHVTSKKLVREVRSKDGKRVFKQIDNPINFSSLKKDTVRLAPPLMGEHTNEILLGLGYSKSQINKFRMYGIL